MPEPGVASTPPPLPFQDHPSSQGYALSIHGSLGARTTLSVKPNPFQGRGSEKLRHREEQSLRKRRRPGHHRALAPPGGPAILLVSSGRVFSHSGAEGAGTQPRAQPAPKNTLQPGRLTWPSRPASPAVLGRESW